LEALVFKKDLYCGDDGQLMHHTEINIRKGYITIEDDEVSCSNDSNRSISDDNKSLLIRIKKKGFELFNSLAAKEWNRYETRNEKLIDSFKSTSFKWANCKIAGFN
jgi:hypothetical protein